MNGKVVFVSTTNSHKGGGVFEVICQLGRALYKKGVDLSITWHNDEEGLKEKDAYGDVPLLNYRQGEQYPLKMIAYSPDMTKQLLGVQPSILHSHGLWMYNSYAVKECKRRMPSIKTVITPHGMLDPWAVKNSGWKKKVVGWLFENENLRSADCVHALNHSEYESIRAYGLTNPIAIIPNGITLPENVIYERGKGRKVMLFIGRIHPKKGIAELLEGISLLRERQPEMMNQWTVRIAGWDQLGHTDFLKDRCKQLELDDFVDFIGPVLGKEKETELCGADAYVLTSFSEGLPMSVLEAWAYRLPVVMTDQCNLPDGFENKAAIHVTTNPQSIADGLTKLFSMTDKERKQIGENGYNLVKKNYTWDSIADQTIQLYDWLLHGGEKPVFVHLD